MVSILLMAFGGGILLNFIISIPSMINNWPMQKMLIVGGIQVIIGLIPFLYGRKIMQETKQA